MLINTRTKRNTAPKKGRKQNILPSQISFRYLHGYCDSYGSSTPIAYKQKAGVPYVDFVASGGSTTSPSGSSMLTPLMTILAANPQYSIPVQTGGAVQWYNQVRLTKMLVKVGVTGSEGGVIAAADLYNKLRANIVWTNNSFSDTTTVTSLIDVDTFEDFHDYEEVLARWDFDLPSVSYDTSDSVNVPMLRHWTGEISLNKMIECYSNVPAGTSGWDTKSGNMFYGVVSDSAASPNPQYKINARIFYDIVRRVI